MNLATDSLKHTASMRGEAQNNTLLAEVLNLDKESALLTQPTKQMIASVQGTSQTSFVTQLFSDAQKIPQNGFAVAMNGITLPQLAMQVSAGLCVSNHGAHASFCNTPLGTGAIAANNFLPCPMEPMRSPGRVCRNVAKSPRCCLTMANLSAVSHSFKPRWKASSQARRSRACATRSVSHQPRTRRKTQKRL